MALRRPLSTVATVSSSKLYLYKKCHVLAHASSHLGADVKVQSALDNKVSRESEWSKKMSFWNASICEDYVEQLRDVNIQKTKAKIKGTLCEEQREHCRSKIAPLVFQGDFLKLVEIEKGDLTWRSLIFNLPKGVLSFITRAAIDALPTADNLSRWGKRMNTRCNLCETLLHILNNCKSALTQERYNYIPSWQHIEIHCFFSGQCETWPHKLPCWPWTCNKRRYSSLRSHTNLRKTRPSNVRSHKWISFAGRTYGPFWIKHRFCPWEKIWKIRFSKARHRSPRVLLWSNLLWNRLQRVSHKGK